MDDVTDTLPMPLATSRNWRPASHLLDGILVPTFGAFYVAVTLLFPFVAIRALGREKETGALKLLVQLPYPIPLVGFSFFQAVALYGEASAKRSSRQSLRPLLLLG